MLWSNFIIYLRYCKGFLPGIVCFWVESRTCLRFQALRTSFLSRAWDRTPSHQPLLCSKANFSQEPTKYDKAKFSGILCLNSNNFTFRYDFEKRAIKGFDSNCHYEAVLSYSEVPINWKKYFISNLASIEINKLNTFWWDIDHCKTDMSQRLMKNKIQLIQKDLAFRICPSKFVDEWDSNFPRDLVMEGVG